MLGAPSIAAQARHQVSERKVQMCPAIRWIQVFDGCAMVCGGVSHACDCWPLQCLDRSRCRGAGFSGSDASVITEEGGAHTERTLRLFDAGSDMRVGSLKRRVCTEDARQPKVQSEADASMHLHTPINVIGRWENGITWCRIPSSASGSKRAWQLAFRSSGQVPVPSSSLALLSFTAFCSVRFGGERLP